MCRLIERGPAAFGPLADPLDQLAGRRLGVAESGKGFVGVAQERIAAFHARETRLFADDLAEFTAHLPEIGRASCRERV